METISRKKTVFKNVFPAILANACVFLFSVVDGIFVGNGAGMNALGAVNIALPFVLVTNHFIFKKGSLIIKRYKPQMKLYRTIIFRGLPEAIAQFSTPVTTLCMNYTLMGTFGEIGINAFSIISYLLSFTMSIFFGASEGMQPLFGQSYGAKEKENLKYYYKAGQIISVVGSSIVWHTFGIYEVLVLIVAIILKKHSERNGIIKEVV